MIEQPTIFKVPKPKGKKAIKHSHVKKAEPNGSAIKFAVLRAATTGQVDVHYASWHPLFMKAAYALRNGKLNPDQKKKPITVEDRRRLEDHIFRMNAVGMTDDVTLAAIFCLLANAHENPCKVPIPHPSLYHFV